MKETFHFTTRFDWDFSTQPEINEVGYGDGYSQRSPNGLNNVLNTYNLSFQGKREDCDDIVSFFRRHGGYKSFYWYAPDQYRDILVVCKSWSQKGNGNNSSVTYTFEQVVN